MRFVRNNNLLNIVYSSAINYPAPSTLSYFWNFGIFALVCLAIQVLTGILLAMHYVPNVDLAFNSVEHIMRDVNYGWLIRYVHANGASMFFIADAKPIKFYVNHFLFLIFFNFFIFIL